MDRVEQFTYLGVIFTDTGKLNRAIKNLTTKAMRASFKTSTTLKSKQMLNSKLYTQLFDYGETSGTV